MPFFSRRKSGKQKVDKHGSGKSESSKTPNTSQSLKQQSVGAGFNGVSTTPDLPRKDLYEAGQRPANSTAKRVANFPRKSRLSKTLPEVLVDDSILPLFLEFLHKQGAQSLLNFWLAAETFRLSSRDKNLVSYKSRLKLRSKQRSTGKMEVFNLQNNSRDKRPAFEVESSESVDNSGSTLAYCNTESTSDNSMNSSLTLPGLNEENNSRSDIPIRTEQITCTDDKTVVVTCAIKDDKNTSPGDVILNDRIEMVSDQNATTVQSPEKNELTRQESRETTERRRMSKVMMDDALSIYRHFISLDATQSLGVDENIRREVESSICTENGIIDPECFSIPQKFAFNTLQNRYFNDFIRSSYYQKHIMDILTSGKVFLADIMYNDSAMFYFMEFMEQEEKSYLLAFWIAVDSFCQELQSKLDRSEYNGNEALEDAMVLYDKYFSMQASNSLGVSDETRIRIENKICREEGPLPDCFEEPMENVLTLLEEVYFPIFLESDVYMKYLNELFSAVTDVDSDQTSVDDCSSTTSANETAKLMESLVDDMDPHDDPDEIWQRPHFGLSIGRVNEFGIYEPGIEPQPGKEVLKFGQKMKKLVSGDSDKMKEEMAWKVAKMVLEDVKKQQKKAR